MPEVFRYGPHHGEEPPVSGTRGSGTIFFSRCTLRCLYCQNYPWSQEGKGKAYSVEELAGAFRALKETGCQNWNLVSPTPWLPLIEEALDALKKDGISLPVVYNTSGFEAEGTLRRAQSVVDVYLTDLRYAREATAREASGVGAYVETARAALREMWRQKGPLKLGADGAALAGTICRMLVLPGHAREVVENLEWLARAVGNGIAVSIMAQYLPTHRAVGRGEWGRRITRAEYDAVCEAVEDLGFSEGWIQDYEGDTPPELVGYRMEPQGER